MPKGLTFEWDPQKAKLNLIKHGISFEEAATIFGDPMAITIQDEDHGDNDFREITIGETLKHRIVVVSHCDRFGCIRIISARKASKSEVKQYNEV